MAEFYEMMHVLASIKNKAFKLGMSGADVDELRNLICMTDYASGLVAEIIVAYLLGMFKRLVKQDGGGVIHVTMSAFLDKCGTDFTISRFGDDHKIQFKFNDIRPYVTEKDVYLFRAAPSRKFRGTNFMNGEIDRGDNIFLNLFVESEVYDEDDIYTFFENHESFAAICREAWEIIRS